MTKFILGVALSLAPAALVAQASASTGVRAGVGITTERASANANTDAAARAHAATDSANPAELSAAGRARLEATFRQARAKHLPEQPMKDRLAEVRARAASETEIITDVQAVEARLEASQQAMIRAGHRNETDGEIAAGARAMEHGFQEGQLTAVARHSAPNRDLTVAFDALGRLAAGGMRIAEAMATVQAKLDANAADDAISSLTAKTAIGASGSAGTNAAAGVNGTAGAAGASVGGAVTGTLGGVLGRRP